MRPYNRLNPLHWLLALVSNSRKNTYLQEGALHVADSPYRATRRLLYWLRNPAHDFTHHIVGFDGEPGYQLVWGYNILGTRGLRAALSRYKWLPLPWVAYDSDRIRFELGWNDAGNLKFKLRRGVPT